MKKTILTLVGNACECAQTADRRTTAAHAAAVAGHKAWEEANPHDVISINPYDVGSTKVSLETARKRLEHLTATYKFAIETFVE